MNDSSQQRRVTRSGTAAIAIAVLLLTCSMVSGAVEKPWWDQEKIRFFWSHWMFFHDFARTGGLGAADGMSDKQLMEALSGVGATVFADRFDWSQDPYYGDTRATRLNRARLARTNGMRYFGQLHSAYMGESQEKVGVRPAVNKDGKTSKEDPRAMGRFVACPLDEKAADAWPFVYAMDMAETGLVDGLHMDWEASVVGFSHEHGYAVCYCDDCWSNFTKKAGARQEVARADRYNRLDKHGLLTAYFTHLQNRLIDIYRRGAARVHAIKPDFIFSAYGGFMPGHIESTWLIEGAARGLNSPDTPFFVIDAGQYSPNHTVPWWDTGYAALRKLGMKHILGFYTGGFMGPPTVDVSAAQQLYDAAINTDGYWLWTERNWGPDDYGVLRTANERVRATENKNIASADAALVGSFLRDGQLDYTFATSVEQSGAPALGRNIVTRTYHLGKHRPQAEGSRASDKKPDWSHTAESSHLVHINNVDTDSAVTVVVRFPRLKGDATWTASDALTDIYYTHKPNTPAWRNQDLKQGVLLSIAKRSEAWLLLTPYAPSVKISPSRMVSGYVLKGHPDRPATGSLPAPGKAAAGGFPLVFTRTGPLGYAGAHQPVLGASVFLIDAAGGAATEAGQIFAVKGNCWSPRLSPDGARVVFSSYVNGKGQIYVVNSDATVETGPPSGQQMNKPYFETSKMHARGYTAFVFKSAGVNISHNDYCEHSPVWSPDGRRIAFVSDRDGDWEIYVMNADGSGQKRLTNSPGIERNPSWSPDGKHIAYESNRAGDFDIYLVGSGSVGLSQHLPGEKQLAAGGERLLVSRSGDDLEPVWSPDGARIAFVGNHYGYNRDIMLVDPRSGALDYPRGLLATIAGWWPYTNVQSISWSPDGRYIAAGFETREESGVFVVRARVKHAAADVAPAAVGEDFDYHSDRKGGDLIELVKAPPLKTRAGGRVMAAVRPPITGPSYGGGDASNRWIIRTFEDVAWSADGRTIAFRSDMDPSGYELFYTVPAAGGEAVRLDNTLSPMGWIGNELKPPNALGASQESAPAWKPPVGARLLAEAPEFWMFRVDPDKVGEARKWFNVSPNGAHWIAVSTHDFWDKLLRTRKEPNYIGDGWYAVEMVIPPARGKKAWLQFGAVDENYTLWINGEYIDDNLAAGTSLWDQPVSVEITDKFIEGQPNHIVVRVRNTAFAGGIWKPVRFLVEK